MDKTQAEKAQDRVQAARRYELQLKEQIKPRGLTADQETFLYKSGPELRATEQWKRLDAFLARPGARLEDAAEAELGWLRPSLGPELWETLLYAAAHLQELPFSQGLNRRGLRSADPRTYLDRLATLVWSLSCKPLLREPLGDILSDRLTGDARAYMQIQNLDRSISPWQVARALDLGDADVERAVRAILEGDSTGPRLSRGLISGVLCCHRPEFWEAAGKLLLAAGLQEGLRQAVCESADQGTREAFLYLLGLIRDRDLIRFSSVKRAVGTWLGVFTAESRDLERINRKSLDLLWDCLHSEARREECLRSRDAMAIYIGLWSLGFEDIGLAGLRILELRDPQQLLAAGYYVQNLQAKHFAHRLAFEVLSRGALELQTAAMWLPSFLPCVGEIHWWDRKLQPPVLTDWFDAPAEMERAWALILDLLGGMKKREYKFAPCLFPWMEISLRRTDLTERLCLLALWSRDPEKRALACGRLADCGTERRAAFLRLLTREKTDQVQRNTILDALADRETTTREAAVSLAENMALRPEEYARILPHLRLKNPETRKAVMALLLRQEDGELIPCLKGLLADPREEVRAAALEMASRCAKDGRSAVSAAVAEAAAANTEPRSAREAGLLSTVLPEKREAEAPLCTPADRYIPTEFDAAYTARIATRWREVFPDSELPDQLLSGKTKGLLGQLAEKLRKKLCPSAQQALEDARDLNVFCAGLEEKSYRDQNGEERLVGDGWYHMDEACFQSFLKPWYESRGMTPERLLRLELFCTSGGENKAADRWIRHLLGPGFDNRENTSTLRNAAYLATRLRLCFPLRDAADLGAALALWSVRCLPEEDLMLPVERGRSFSTYGISCKQGHLLAERRLSKLLGLLECRDDETLALRFPIAAACTERCLAAAERAEWVKGAMSSFDSSERLGRSMISLGTGRRADDLPAGAGEYLLAAWRGLITPAQFFSCLFDGGDLYRGLLLLTGLTAELRDGKRSAATRGRYAYGRTRELTKLKELYLGHALPIAEADGARLRFAEGLCGQAVRRVLAAELVRGEGETPYSAAVVGIQRLYGAETLVSILKALGSTPLDRSVYYAYLNVTDRKSCLSHLLSVCVPGSEETAADLAAALQGSGISRRRLVEAALYSPAWIELIGEQLGISGFRSGCYYFMAHMNENFDEQRMAVIARFTPLSKEELAAGAFDLDWFRSAYAALGEKDFGLIYDAAKYISDGARHTRARKYADAALGRFAVAETEAQIAEKRNKDLLMAYPLIPLKGEEDLLRRYLFIQRFKKESKQFGAQRSASEAKAAETALVNLARNAGYADPMLLTLRMEALDFASRRELLEPRTLEGVTLRLCFDADGKAELSCEKNGKALKSIPAGLKKKPEVLELTAAKKALAEQHRRTRTLLEQAMEDQTPFPLAELRALQSHPVVWPMLEKLVFLAGEQAGFLTGAGLADAGGGVCALPEDVTLTLAHPIHLYKLGLWRAFQQYLYDRRIVQPFRQVFRELYVKTEEELTATKSLRYSGNQILPAKTCAVLKSRRWVLDMESGLQKVYYRENLVAELWALADWFSPADIEAPTLEYVVFLDRRSWEPVPLREVPELIFSEVMRDVDLAVSVAHAGGVDPETSHSTVELRQAMLECLLPILKLDNVRVEKHHAFIHGALADYRVHLGSGVVHQAGGAMLPVLPVHSQHRGRIFLPFADEDPKTAEVLSKVLLFAEDKKIKDPSILAMIR